MYSNTRDQSKGFFILRVGFHRKCFTTADNQQRSSS